MLWELRLVLGIVVAFVAVSMYVSWHDAQAERLQGPHRQLGQAGEQVATASQGR